MDIHVLRKSVNLPTLTAEMEAAIGEAWQGWSARKDEPEEYRLHVVDGATAETIQSALAVYAAHNPAVLAPSQVLAARRAAAEQDLRAADFKQTLQAINALAIPQEAKVVLRQILLLQYKSALATGIIDTPDPTQ